MNKAGQRIEHLLDEVIEALEAQPLDRERLKALRQRANELLKETTDAEDSIALREAIRDLEEKLGAMGLPAKHAPEAERLMEEAERAFLERNYRKTIALCGPILEIEPDWERAQDLEYKAEEYQAGRIPPEDLPPKALLLFEKAKSALRVRRYDAARGYIQEVHDALRGQNITSFTELIKLEAQLEQEQLAWKVYEEGIDLLSEGKWESAIQKITNAADLSGLPEHRAKEEVLRKDWEQIEKIREQVYGNLSVDEMVQTARALKGLESRYWDNPVLVALDEELTKRIEHEVAEMERQISRKIAYAQKAPVLNDAKKALQEVEVITEQLGALGRLGNISLQDVRAQLDEAKGRVAQAETVLDRFRSALQFGGNYEEIKEITTRFEQALKEADVERFAEVVELEAQLRRLEEAQKDFDEGLASWKEGKWEEAVRKAASAAEVFKFHKGRANSLREDWKRVKAIENALISGESRQIGEVERTLQALEDKYPNNNGLKRLRTRLSQRAGELLEETEMWLEDVQDFQNFPCPANARRKLRLIEERLRVVERVRNDLREKVRVSKDELQEIATQIFEDQQALQSLEQNPFDDQVFVTLAGLRAKYPDCREIANWELQIKYLRLISDAHTSEMQVLELLHREVSQKLLGNLADHELWLLHEWIGIQMRAFDRQALFRDYRLKNARMLQKQSWVWFYLRLYPKNRKGVEKEGVTC